MPSAREIDLIKRFLAENLGEDDSTFRQNFVSDFTVLVVRLRDNALSAFRKELKNADQGSNTVGNIWNHQGSQLINQVTDMHDIMTILFDNLYGGANYQRLISALDLLTTFHFGMFEYEAHRGMNKTSGNGDPTPLIKSLSRLVISATDRSNNYIYKQASPLKKLLLIVLFVSSTRPQCQTQKNNPVF